MFLFTQVGLTSDGIHQTVAVDPQAVVEQSVLVLPKKDSQKNLKKKGEVSGVLTVEQTVKQYYSSTPILADIARCESRFRQFDSEGNVLRGKVNMNDIGVMQINEKYHSAEAKSLGLDIHTLKGNLAYAKNLYEEQGTSPWSSSGGCWGSKVATVN